MIQPETNISLQSFNTLGVPSTADYYVSAVNITQIIQALAWAKEHDENVLVLSGGSNIVLQGDFKGLCLHVDLKGIDCKKTLRDTFLVTAAAGENWHEFVAFCLGKGAYGLENLALIPGCVGAAPVQNIGAYGVEIKDFMVSLEAISRDTGELRRFTRDECGFAYRDSVFKTVYRDQYVITAVTFELPAIPAPNLSYAALANTLSDKQPPAPEDVFSAVVAMRSAKLPNPAEIANVGSFFKNPVVTQLQFSTLKQEYGSIVGFPDPEGVKLAAGWLIDNAGWKGVLEDGVGVHRNQALVITNPGNCDGNKIIALAERIQADVKKRYNVVLEIEPRVY